MDELQCDSDERYRLLWEERSDRQPIEAFQYLDRMDDRERSPFEDEVERRSLILTTKLATNGAVAFYDSGGPKGAAGELQLLQATKIPIGVL